jgi:hypothetical protein
MTVGVMDEVRGRASATLKARRPGGRMTPTVIKKTRDVQVPKSGHTGGGKRAKVARPDDAAVV